MLSGLYLLDPKLGPFGSQFIKGRGAAGAFTCRGRVSTLRSINGWFGSCRTGRGCCVLRLGWFRLSPSLSSRRRCRHGWRTLSRGNSGSLMLARSLMRAVGGAVVTAAVGGSSIGSNDCKVRRCRLGLRRKAGCWSRSSFLPRVSHVGSSHRMVAVTFKVTTVAIVRLWTAPFRCHQCGIRSITAATRSGALLSRVSIRSRRGLVFSRMSLFLFFKLVGSCTGRLDGRLSFLPHFHHTRSLWMIAVAAGSRRLGINHV